MLCERYISLESLVDVLFGQAYSTSSASLSVLPADVFRSPNDDAAYLYNFTSLPYSPHRTRHILTRHSIVAASPSDHFDLTYSSTQFDLVLLRDRKALPAH